MELRLKIIGILFAVIYIVLATFLPITSVLVVGVLVIVIFIKIKSAERSNILFYILIFSAMLGPYLSIPGLGAIFLFRITLFFNIIYFFKEKKNFNRIKKMKWPLIFLGLWTSYTILTLFWTESITLSIVAVYYQLEVTYVIFIMVYTICDWKVFNRVSWAVTAAYICNLIYGVIQNITGVQGRYSTGSLLNYSDYRPSGFFINTNDFSAFLILFIGIVIYAITRKRSWIATTAVVILLILVVYLTLQTNSRTGLIGLLLILGCLFTRKWSVLRGLLTLLIINGVALFLYINYTFLLEHSIIHRVTAIFTGKTGSTNERMDMYKGLWGIFQKNPFHGIGVGVSPAKVFEILFGNINIDPQMGRTMGAHNFFLSSLTDLGILGFACMILFSGAILFMSMRVWVCGSSIVYLIPITIFIGFICISIGSSSIYTTRIVWIGLGILLAIVNLLREEVSEKPD
ncbi:O-antigen ligase family protein [Listeria rocourtiae]|uniref:O-antigen ligase family protein n=1 Tax=Listeria rocourtiae TaxID=647910 RepID=UPI00162487C7|nr:O-antigen ligase family protein [Listeria rocourtiae]MBC1605347.1 O-antigen ligase family protein [Listeria rocourtiae]